MDIYLIRHTRVALDSGICYGQSEIELAPEFDQQLAELKQQLPQKFDAVYSSPLQRCTRLAEQFSAGIEQDDRLKEYNFGDWEMQPWDDINTAELYAWMQDFVQLRPPGGETLVEMFARVSQFMDELRQTGHQQSGHQPPENKQILISTHAGVIRCVWAYLLQIPLAQIFKINVGYGKALKIHLGDNPDHDAVFTD
jgi:alpha-ribazole phosphatase